MSLINGGYAQQTKKYKPMADSDALQAAFYWAKKHGVSRSGRYWNFLLQENDRLIREMQARESNKPCLSRCDYLYD